MSERVAHDLIAFGCVGQQEFFPRLIHYVPYVRAIAGATYRFNIPVTRFGIRRMRFGQRQRDFPRKAGRRRLQQHPPMDFMLDLLGSKHLSEHGDLLWSMCGRVFVDGTPVAGMT